MRNNIPKKKQSMVRELAGFAWNGLIAVIVLGFVASMIESFAQLQQRKEATRASQSQTRTDSKGRVIKRTFSRKQ